METNANRDHYSGANGFISRLNEIIDKNLNRQQYTLDNLASDLYMCKSSLNKKVKLATGLTPVEYLVEKRLIMAAGLMQQQQYSIKEIAYISGFNDPKYFSRCFKRKYGLTPKEYTLKIRKPLSFIWDYFILN